MQDWAGLDLTELRREPSSQSFVCSFQGWAPHPHLTVCSQPWHPKLYFLIPCRVTCEKSARPSAEISVQRGLCLALLLALLAHSLCRPHFPMLYVSQFFLNPFLTSGFSHTVLRSLNLRVTAPPCGQWVKRHSNLGFHRDYQAMYTSGPSF